MPKVTVHANEIVKPDVDIVALVNKGANRIPFRITKEEGSDMIDVNRLTNMLFQKRDEYSEVTVVGALFSKGSDVDELVRLLAEAGVDVSGDGFTKSENDVAVTLTKSDLAVGEEDLLILKMNEDVVLTLAGPSEIIKRVSCYDFESTSFSEVMSKSSFLPSLAVANDTLMGTFGNILEKAESKKELASMMKKASEEFASYVSTLVASVPDSIFKADIALQKMKDMDSKKMKDMKMKDKKGKSKDMDYSEEDDKMKGKMKGKMKKEDISAMPAFGTLDTDTRAPKAGAVSNNIDGDPAVGNETPRNPPMQSNGPVGSASNDLDGNPAIGDAHTSQPMMKGVMESIAALQQTLEKGLSDVKKYVDQSVSGVRTEISGLSEKVAKTEQTLTGTVIADSVGDRTGKVSKSEDEVDNLILIDTAFTPLSKLEEQEKKVRNRG